MIKKKDNSKKKFSDEELSQILKNVKKNRKLVMAKTSSSNATDKDALWKKITKDVNSVSLHTRECAQIKKKWSDWSYTTKKKKKHLSARDQELIDFLNADDDSESQSGDKLATRNLVTELEGKVIFLLFI